MNEARKQRMIREALGGSHVEFSAGSIVGGAALVLMVLVAAGLSTNYDDEAFHTANNAHVETAQR